MKFGYARISTPKQSLENQIASLKEDGCIKVFADTVSGFNSQKKEFERLMEMLREGDTLTVTGIDRLGRSTKELAILIEELHTKEISLSIVGYPELDTRTSSGKMIFNFMAMIAENERMRNMERIQQGLAAARKRGIHVGRPKKLTFQKTKRMIEIYNEKRLTTQEICIMYGISKVTLYNYLKKEQNA